MRALSLIALLALSMPLFAQKQFGFDNTKGSGQEYLKPEETVKRMKIAPEFDIKLFAAEPDCVNPIAFSIDEKGRIWVVECFEYPSKTPKGKAPRDRIVILEDTDGDGKCDKRTVFAEGKDFPVPKARKDAGLGAFDLASGLEVGHGKVFLGAPPYLWEIEIGQDDKPGKFEPVLSGFGSEDTHETLNTFQWGPDGWLYGMHGIFTQSTVKSLDGPETRMNAAVWRYHPKQKSFEIYAEGTSNPWGMDWRNTDGQFILACCVIPHLYHIVPGGIYKRQAGGSYNPYVYGYINEISDHTFHKESGWAHAGLISLDAPHIPEKYRNSVIFGSIHGCSLKQNILKPNGSSYTASRGDDFLVSGDKNFRPINMKWGPNGDIYLIDWHDQNPCHQAKASDWDYERGRVYRIEVKGRKGGKARDLSKASDGELAVLALADEDPYLNRTALRMLAGKPKADIKAGMANKQLAPSASLPFLRLVHSNGDYELDEIHEGKVDQPEMADGIALAIRMARGQSLTVEQIEKMTKVVGQLELAKPRREMASLAISLAEKHDVTELVHALMKNKDDAKDPLIPQLTWIAYEKVLAKQLENKKDVSGKLAEELVFLAEESPENIFVRDAIVPKTMRRLVATGKAEDLKLCLKFLENTKDLNTREKALDGLVIALSGQSVEPPEGWKALKIELKKEAKLAPMLEKIAVSFRDPEAIERGLTVLADTNKSGGERAEAIRQLVQMKAKQAPELLVKLVKTESNMQLRTEAARSLVALDKPELAGELLAGWTEFPSQVKSELINSFSGRKPWAIALMNALKSKVIDRSELGENVISKMQAFNDKELNDLIGATWGRTRKTPEELNKLIDKTRDSLAAKPGSFENGKKVFEAQCAKCHKFEGKGQEVGPALDGAARDIEYLLANVLDPNRVIGAPYFVRTANLLDGQIIQGILHEEDAANITLKIEGGVLKKLSKKDLDGPVKVAEKSMMPEGLSYGMTEQDFRDLVRYAMKNPFVNSVSIDGKTQSTGAQGRFELPTAKETVAIAEFTASKAFKTKLLIGASDAFKIELDGIPVGSGKGVGPNPSPDREGFDIEIKEGKHTLKVTFGEVKKPGVLYLRFIDGDRLLKYAEGR